MKIFFTGKNHSQALKIDDQTSFTGVARELGHEVVYSLEDKPEQLICVDYEKASLSKVRQSRTIGIKTVLIANEPAVVIPEHAQSRLKREFDLVLEVGRWWTEPHLRWPQTWLTMAENSERLDRVVLVNADKWSFVKGQQYWLRSAAASRLDSVDVFGFGWDRSVVVRFAHRSYELMRTVTAGLLPSFDGIGVLLATPKSYKGSVYSKLTEMRRYKVALVVENSSEFLSEKLFDAWFAGCIPVYVGPPVEPYGIPKDLIVGVEEPNLVGITEAVEKAMAMDRDLFSRRVKDFLGSTEAAKWKANEALKSILNAATAVTH